MNYGNYLRAVWSRAWRDSWRAVVQHSFQTLLRDAVILAVTAAIWLRVRDEATRLGWAGDGLLGDTLTWVAVTAAAVAVTFLALLMLEGLLIAPFKLLRESGFGKVAAPPLEIRYDMSNPGGRYWQESEWMPDNGSPLRRGMEYRIEIANLSDRTAHDVVVTMQGEANPDEDGTLRFLRTRKFTATIHPGAVELAQVMLITGPGAGVPRRTTIRVTARDMQATHREFIIDTSKTPALTPLQD